MSQPVKLSDALVLDARITGEIVERSIAGQVEFWARLGRSIEPLIEGETALALCRSAAARPLVECLEQADSAQGRKRLAAYLESQPFPHYAAHPEVAGLLIRTDAEGRRTTGRFVNRKFEAVKVAKRAAAR